MAKPLFWIATSKPDLKTFPAEVQQLMGFALWQAQNGKKHVDAKPLRGFGGARVLEIAEDFDGNAFRTVYTVKFAEAIYVLHAFQKKSKRGWKTPKHVIDLIKKRLRDAQVHYENWLTENPAINQGKD